MLEYCVVAVELVEREHPLAGPLLDEEVARLCLRDQVTSQDLEPSLLDLQPHVGVRKVAARELSLGKVAPHFQEEVLGDSQTLHVGFKSYGVLLSLRVSVSILCIYLEPRDSRRCFPASAC